MGIRTARAGPYPVEWRFRRGWSEAELASRLRRIDARAVNFDAGDELVAERGWNEARSCALIAREAPGPPLPGGAFERARHLVAGFEHSDPRIAVAHFDPAAPFARRPALLQIHALGLRFLCPVAVARQREVATAAGATWGFALETLCGHLARGREWFVLEKDACSGEVRFRIEAAWRAGDFPGLWAFVGYQVLGRAYRRAWHRRAHARLRRLLAVGAERSARGLLAHSGRPIAAQPIEPPGRTVAPSARAEREDERTRWDRWALVAGFGALAGARSMSAPALLALAGARARSLGGSRLSQAVSTRGGAAALAACALCELAADKWPRLPSRTAAPTLAWRALSGAASGELLAARAQGPAWRGAFLGGVAAAAATFATFRLRQRIARRVSEPAAGFVEDALVLAAGGAMLSWMGAFRRRSWPQLAGRP